MKPYVQLFAVFLTFLLLHTSPAETGLAGKDLPIKVSFRKSRANDSLVARFTNTSNDVFLTAFVTFKNSTYNESKRRKLSVGPGKTVEVGWAQGWKVMSGETITIESEGYSALVVTVP
jgi:hypothetical protein